MTDINDVKLVASETELKASHVINFDYYTEAAVDAFKRVKKYGKVAAEKLLEQQVRIAELHRKVATGERDAAYAFRNIKYRQAQVTVILKGITNRAARIAVEKYMKFSKDVLSFLEGIATGLLSGI